MYIFLKDTGVSNQDPWKIFEMGRRESQWFYEQIQNLNSFKDYDDDDDDSL